MHNFKYGSRVIENERTVSMETHIVQAGNTIRSIVRLFGMFAALVLVNLLLKNIAERPVVSLNGMLMVKQSAYFVVNESALSALSFVYQHMFSVVLALLGGVAVCVAVVLLCGKACAIFVHTRKQGVHGSVSQSAQSVFQAVSYKQKVCFLS